MTVLAMALGFLSLRQRIVGLVTLVTAVGIGLAFVAVAMGFSRTQRNHLDAALREVAQAEALEVPSLGFAFSTRPGPSANDVGPLPKHGVIYDPAGKVRATTPFFAASPPPRASLADALGDCFDFGHEGQHLRGLLVPVPGAPGMVLLMATSRDDIESDDRFLQQGMVLAFVAVLLWAVLVGNVGAGLLTREIARIADVVRGAATGRLEARATTEGQDQATAQLARDLDALLDNLRASLASQQRFVANAAHELRSPLTRIIGELQLALRKEREPEAYQRSITRALQGSKHLAALAEDLLALARVTSTSPKHEDGVSLNAVLGEAIGYVAEAAAARQVELGVEGIEVAVKGEPADLVRLFRNLLENAVRHAPEGSRVAVAITRAGEEVRARVVDAGEGIPDDQRLRVFDPFFRGAKVRPTAGGAGLGLGIAREIARSHGGDLVLDPPSRDRKGASFTVSLPGAARLSGDVTG